jgi:hypothetical protein
VDELDHLLLVHLLQVLLAHHQTLEEHYQNHRLVLEQDLLLEQELVPLVEPTFVVE